VTEKVLFAVLVSSEFLAAVSMVCAATPNNNNSITYFELALLAEDVYKKDIDNRGVNGWEPDVITGTANNFDSGQ
jgi:hypothetical protein